jgi:tRNA/tmRNA/rRNA uracil-C5-methylase (TrmA/RlmC/RlmD family)
MAKLSCRQDQNESGQRVRFNVRTGSAWTEGAPFHLGIRLQERNNSIDVTELRMADEPDNLVLVMLRDIRAKQNEHSANFERIEKRLGDIEKQLDDYKKIARYALGQSSETQFRQVQQEARIDELFEKLEKLLTDKPPA